MELTDVRDRLVILAKIIDRFAEAEFNRNGKTETWAYLESSNDGVLSGAQALTNILTHYSPAEDETLTGL